MPRYEGCVQGELRVTGSPRSLFSECQERGQTGSFAIILCVTRPSEELVSFVNTHKGNSETEILIEYKTRKKTPTLHAPPLQMERKNTLCNQVWKQHGELIAVITVTRHNSLVLISECKAKQNN